MTKSLRFAGPLVPPANGGSEMQSRKSAQPGFLELLRSIKEGKQKMTIRSKIALSPFAYFSHSQTSRVGAMVLALIALVICAAAPAAYTQTTYSVLYDFGTNTGDPRNPSWPGVFAQGRDGNLYSTSQTGGIGYGTVFQLTPAGKVKVLYQFPLGTNSHGGSPQGGLTLGRDGYLYGTTLYLGSSGAGSVFKIATDGTAYTTLHSFTPGITGYLPYTAPIQGLDGNFYGTTAYGHTTGLTGSVYKMTPTGVLTTLYEFDKSHGVLPLALMQATDGNFYGTTETGGTGICNAQCGVIFKMTPAGQLVWVHNFTNTDGNHPYGPIIQASDGNFYGTTRSGGSSGEGVVYKITPAGVYTVLFNFNATAGSGTNPVAGVVQATDGKLYGAAITALAGHGILYQISSAGTYTTLYTFTPTTGQLPFVSLIQNTNGILYGDTYGGGTGSLCHCGVAYSLNRGLHPFAALLTTSGKAGQVIQILGNGLTGTTSVKFGTGSASFTVVSDTYMIAVVPATGTTGAVTVATPSGFRVSSKNFRILPVISNFSPTSGPAGSQVAITGTGLTQTTKVTFGGVAATNFTKSATKVTATVPTGAVTGKIGITTTGGTATSATVFTVP
jgi:uncharacterized repeat protein (TIGR03803 family)